MVTEFFHRSAQVFPHRCSKQLRSVSGVGPPGDAARRRGAGPTETDGDRGPAGAGVGVPGWGPAVGAGVGGGGGTRSRVRSREPCEPCEEHGSSTGGSIFPSTSMTRLFQGGAVLQPLARRLASWPWSDDGWGAIRWMQIAAVK